MIKRMVLVWTKKDGAVVRMPMILRSGRLYRTDGSLYKLYRAGESNLLRANMRGSAILITAEQDHTGTWSCCSLTDEEILKLIESQNRSRLEKERALTSNREEQLREKASLSHIYVHPAGPGCLWDDQWEDCGVELDYPE